MTLRIVSLVPSLTELCFDLDLGAHLCGRTDYCIAPKGQVEGIASVGGPKSVDPDALRAACPTHVLISPEENLPGIVAEITACDAETVAVQPLAPADNRDLFRRFGKLFDCETRAEALEARLDIEIAQTRAFAAATPRLRVLPLVWKNPWVTVHPATYVAAMLAAVGLDVVATGDALYPRLNDLAESARTADWVLPTTEPYPFDTDAIMALKSALGRETVALVDGEAVAWYGSRAIAALPLLAAFKRGLLDSAAVRS